MKTLLLSLVLALGAYFTRLDAVDAVARLLAPAVALLATGIFPCMSLAVGAMKGEQRSPKLVDDLFSQLHQLLRLLVATFALAVITLVALALVTGLVAAATSKEATTLLPAWPRGAAALAAFSFTMLVGRIVDVGRAFFAVLDINRTHALLVARARSEGQRQAVTKELTRERFPNDDVTPRPLQPAE